MDSPLLVEVGNEPAVSHSEKSFDEEWQQVQPGVMVAAHELAVALADHSYLSSTPSTSCSQTTQAINPSHQPRQPSRHTHSRPTSPTSSRPASRTSSRSASRFSSRPASPTSTPTASHRSQEMGLLKQMLEVQNKIGNSLENLNDSLVKMNDNLSEIAGAIKCLVNKQQQ